jgi:cytochrome c biogenesis protein CcmG/thiol:disulfide interchange protein DsbE
MRYAIPVLVLLGLLALFAIGLTLDPGKVPSPLIGKPAPALELPILDSSAEPLTLERLKGEAVLVNYWASWCTPCLQEHPLLMELARSGVKIIGINYKDEPQDARQWLARNGNPFSLIAQDLQGKAGLDWGVYGVPETFVLDTQGVIRHKQIGPMTREAWERDIAPRLKSST